MYQFFKSGSFSSIPRCEVTLQWGHLKCNGTAFAEKK